MSSSFGLEIDSKFAPPRVVPVNSDAVITANSFGDIHVIGGTNPVRITLPTLSVPSEFTNELTFINDSTQSALIQATGTDVIRTGGSSIMVLALAVGDWVRLYRISDRWIAETVAAKAATTGATFTGDTVVPDQDVSDASSKAANTRFVSKLISARGLISGNAPTLAGAPQLSEAIPQFDNTYRPATTEFVRRSAQAFGDCVGISTNTTLNNTHFGKYIEYTGNSDAVVTLPEIISGAIGQVITVRNSASAANVTVMVRPAVSAYTIDVNGTTTDSFPLFRGRTLKLVNTGGFWRQADSMSVYVAIDAHQGILRDSSGVIWQWGSVSTPTGNGDIVTVHVPFPHGMITAFGNDGAGGRHSIGIEPQSPSSFKVWSGPAGGSSASTYFKWLAIGY
jgi:hypothetical protein